MNSKRLSASLEKVSNRIHRHPKVNIKLSQWNVISQEHEKRLRLSHNGLYEPPYLVWALLNTIIKDTLHIKER